MTHWWVCFITDCFGSSDAFVVTESLWMRSKTVIVIFCLHLYQSMPDFIFLHSVVNETATLLSEIISNIRGSSNLHQYTLFRSGTTVPIQNTGKLIFLSSLGC